MKKYPLLALFVFLLTNCLSAQKPTVDLDRSYYSDSVKEYHGSPFYNPNWKRGYVLLKNGIESNVVKMKYDVHKNDVVFKRNGNLLKVPPQKINGFVLMDDTIKTKFINGLKSAEHDISLNDYLRIIYDGDIKFIAEHNVDFQEGRNHPLKKDIKSKYVSSIDYFLIKQDGTYEAIKLNNEEVITSLNSNREILIKFATEHNLSFSSERDVKSIIEQFDR